MTIFPCCRCGITPPEPRPGPADKSGLPSMQLRHRCRRDERAYKITCCAADPDAAALDCIFCWNEQNAKEDPRWWPERYDYLRGSCRSRGGAAE